MKRKLGHSGIEVSAVGMGCWAIGGPFWSGDTPLGWGDIDDAESIRAIHRALDLGATFFDTADVYGTGHSEQVLAQALKGRRDQVVIATKFGNTFDAETRQATGPDDSPEHVRAACEASLRRLNTDYIDLYQFHIGGCPIDIAIPVRETLEELVKAGKIRAYGWSTDTVDSARDWTNGPHNTAVQHQQNLLNDNAEMIALCEEFNLASINRGPLAMGLLTGKYTAASDLPQNDVRGKDAPEWMQYFRDGKPNPDFLQKMEAVRDILTSDGRTLTQGALGWLWARSEQTIPIPGFKTIQQVEENCRAMEFGPLKPEQMQEIEVILGRATA